MNRFNLLIAALALTALTFTATAQEAANFRRYTTRTGQTFYASVVQKDNLSVTFKLQNGKPSQLMIKELSAPDQQFVRKWTKFKEDLMTNAQFAKLTVKEMLEMRGYQSFEFDIEGNHIYIEGEMNGKQTKFMVDTGADTSLLHIAAAKDGGVEVGPMDQVIRGVAGTQPAAVCVVKSIKLGDAIIENRKILATDLGLGGPPPDFDAIFGADFLRELDAVISYREGRMFLKPDNLRNAAANNKTPPSAPTQGYGEVRRWTTSENKNFVATLLDKDDSHVTFRMSTGQIAKWEIAKLADPDKDIVAKFDKLREILAKNPEWRTLTVKELLELRAYQSFQYRASGNHILVDGSVGTTKATFLIDTGAGSGLFDFEFSKKAGLEVGPMDQELRGIGGITKAGLTKVPKLTMGDALIENRIMLTRAPVKMEDTHDAIFGADFLRELDGVISYKEARIFLKPDNSDQAAKPAEKPADKPAEKKDEKPAVPAKPATPPAAKPGPAA